MCRLRDKKGLNRDYDLWKYLIIREADVIKMEILQVGHSNFAWILFHLVMCLAHPFLYFRLRVSATVLSLPFLTF